MAPPGSEDAESDVDCADGDLPDSPSSNVVFAARQSRKIVTALTFSRWRSAAGKALSPSID
jgi:hypothetical protein